MLQSESVSSNSPRGRILKRLGDDVLGWVLWEEHHRACEGTDLDVVSVNSELSEEVIPVLPAQPSFLAEQHFSGFRDVVVCSFLKLPLIPTNCSMI